jgi:hypothetical protein
MIAVPELDNITVALQTGADKVLPPMADIPEEFKTWHPADDRWLKFLETWFFSGIKGLELTPKPGVDKAKALQAIGAAIGDFGPSQEHKMWGLAYLCSQWFEDVQYQAVK